MLKKAMKNWEHSDYTAEDLIFSLADGWRRNLGTEFENYRSLTYLPDLRTICLSTAFWNTTDYTPEKPSLADQCTIFLRTGLLNLVKKFEAPYGIDLNEDSSSIDVKSIEDQKLGFGKIADELLSMEIYDIFKECSKENWDGSGAKPISIRTCLTAVKLAESLPQDLPKPDVIPEPTGEIAFEWYRGKGYVFVLSVSDENKVSYAGLFGTDCKSFGSEYFHKEIPLAIISKIRRLYV